VAATPEPKAGTQPSAAAQPAPPAPVRAARPVPDSPDPLAGKFDLAQALAGLPGRGELHAVLSTDMGNLDCKLFPDKAPLTVANFVGLARGLRPFWDAEQGAWVRRPLYDGTTFHRAIAGFMIQGGDHLGTGRGEVGYQVPDEIWPGTKHDRAGLLCMANKGPNTNGGQFFITDAPAPHLTQMNSYTVFGACTPVDVVHRIAGAPAAAPGSERPARPVTIRRVLVDRR
jgi:peptidyl-prolyl cis-trans isomerase A (cyclophilin A)